MLGPTGTESNESHIMHFSASPHVTVGRLATRSTLDMACLGANKNICGCMVLADKPLRRRSLECTPVDMKRHVSRRARNDLDCSCMYGSSASY
eukprot:scaffold95869_cov42-Prasinocladus_malaysianus.AAC.1